MKNVVRFRFIVAALTVSLGCYGLLAHWPSVGLFFSFPPILTLSRSEMTRSVPNRELLISLVTVLAFVGVILACKWLTPNVITADVQHAIRHPAFVIPFWILGLGSLYRIYRRQRREAEA